MKTVTFYLIMVCDFKFVLWINCEAELIREEKQKKTPQSAAFGIICIFLAGCGVNALSDNVNLLAYFRPGITQPNGAVKYRFFRSAVAAVQAEVTLTFKLERFAGLCGFQRRFGKALLDHQ